MPTALGLTRIHLQRPMLLTKANGVIRHPNGDAVPSFSTAHSEASLHKFGIDHTKSAQMAEGWVEDERGLCVAQDWDCNIKDPDELFGVYHDCLLKMRFDFPPHRWTGIGLYPDWHNPGYHTDLRDLDNPLCGARWFVIHEKVGKKTHYHYEPLTWKNWKEKVLGRN